MLPLCICMVYDTSMIFANCNTPPRTHTPWLLLTVATTHVLVFVSLPPCARMYVMCGAWFESERDVCVCVYYYATSSSLHAHHLSLCSFSLDVLNRNNCHVICVSLLVHSCLSRLPSLSLTIDRSYRAEQSRAVVVLYHNNVLQQQQRKRLAPTASLAAWRQGCLHCSIAHGGRFCLREDIPCA
jgi:hypothetical protein